MKDVLRKGNGVNNIYKTEEHTKMTKKNLTRWFPWNELGD
jgi:hypothetical protein